MSETYPRGARIGPYKVLKELGSGGMGTVLRVERVRDGEQFALKFCTEEDDELRRRFAREVRAMREIDHPNVVKVIDEDLEHDPPYFVMPKAEHSLEEETEALSRDHGAAIDAFLQMCAGVSAIHECVGPHRDLKPHNALRFADGTVAVSDFGLVKFDPRDTTVLTRTSVVLGTTMYMAPEQRRLGGSKHAETLVDVYALGATFYELLTDDEPPPTDFSALPPQLARIVRKATSIPAERYQSVDDMAEAVRDYQRQLRRGKSPVRYFVDARDAIKRRVAAEGKLEEAEVRDLLAATRGLLAQPDVLLDEFDQVPADSLDEMAQRWPELLVDALDAYREALGEVVGGKAFEYAESVAKKMQRIFKRAKLPTLKAIALRAALVAASDLNRFAALDTLEEMLRYVKRDETAAAVAGALRDEAKRFKRHLDRYRRGDLHRLLRDVVDELGGEGDAEP